MTRVFTDRPAALEEQLAQLNEQLTYLVQRQKRTEELIEDLTPILKEMTSAATNRLQDLEERGYFAFGQEAMRVVDQVVTGYSPEDVRQLGDNIVGILDVVRGMTQPDMLALANSATEAIQQADRARPLGLYGMMKASKNNDVRRGFGVMIELLRRVGRTANRMSSGSSRRLAERIAPRRRLDAAPRPADTTARRARRQEAPIPEAEIDDKTAATVDGVDLDKEGFLCEAAQWSEELATRLASAAHVALTEEHWKAVSFARQDYLATGASPNIRRMAAESGLSVRDLYRLFPQAPGKTIARIAGIPKPGGCL